jgi:4-hydroxybenzoate polyprenyltransferase
MTTMPSQQTRRREQPAGDRGWKETILSALALVVLATVASALINPLLDRTVHWNIVAVLMPSLFVLFALLFRKRWV